MNSDPFIRRRKKIKRILGRFHADCGCGFEYATDGKRRMRLPNYHLRYTYPYSRFWCPGREVSNRELRFRPKKLSNHRKAILREGQAINTDA